MRNTEHFHGTPQDTYDRLVELYGETIYTSEKTGNTTRWVSIGAGKCELTFFARVRVES